MDLQEMLTQPPAGGLAARASGKEAGSAESDGRFAAAFDTEQSQPDTRNVGEDAAAQTTSDNGGEPTPQRDRDAEASGDRAGDASDGDAVQRQDASRAAEESETRPDAPARQAVPTTEAGADALKTQPSAALVEGRTVGGANQGAGRSGDAVQPSVPPPAAPTEAKAISPGTERQTMSANTETRAATARSQGEGFPAEEAVQSKTDPKQATLRFAGAGQTVTPASAQAAAGQGAKPEVRDGEPDVKIMVRGAAASDAPGQPRDPVVTATRATNPIPQGTPSAEVRNAQPDRAPEPDLAQRIAPEKAAPRTAPTPAPVASEAPVPVAQSSGQETAARPMLSAESLYLQTSTTLAPTAPKPVVMATQVTAPLPAEFQTPAMVERQIAPQLIAAAGTRTNGGVVEVFLDPPELGRIEITLELSDQGVRAVLAAERSATGDLLRRHLDLLNQQFAEAGFEQIDLDFSAFGEGLNRDTAAEEQEVQASSPIPKQDVPAARPVPTASHVGMTTVDIRL